MMNKRMKAEVKDELKMNDEYKTVHFFTEYR